MSSGPKEQSKNFYKRSPFNSAYKIKTDKFLYTVLIEIVLRFPPINGNLTPRLFLHLARFTEKKTAQNGQLLTQKALLLVLVERQHPSMLRVQLSLHRASFEVLV